MKVSCIVHNKLDDMQYHDVFQGSFILHRYLKQGTLLFDDYDDLMKDIFLLLYKMALRMNPYVESEFNYEILLRLKSAHRVGKLRRRTKGNVAETYIALKYLLDGLLDHARGKVDMRSLQDMLLARKKLEKELEAEMKHDYLQSLLEASSLHTLLSEKEAFNLKALLGDLLEQSIGKPLESCEDALEGAIQDLLDFTFPELFDEEVSEKAQNPFKDKLERAVTSTPGQNDNPIEALIDRMKRLKDDALPDKETSLEEQRDDTFKTEVLPSSSEPETEWQSKLKDEFEERFEPYLKDQFLVPRDDAPDKGSLEQPLQNSDSVDETTVVDKVSESQDGMPVAVEIQGIDSTTEDTLRSRGAKSGRGASDISNPRKARLLSKLDELAQLNRKIKKDMQAIDFESIIDESAKAIDHFMDNIETLGMDKGSLSTLGFDEIISMNSRFRHPKFIHFINKIGRNKLYARKLQYKKRHEASVPIEKVTNSHHIDWMVDDEYIALALDIDAFENDFYDRYLQDHLLTFELVAERDRRKGPIILCYDGSGSMEGTKIEETQAHIISIMEIAKIQKRRLVLIQFASKTEPLFIKELNPLAAKAKDVLDILDTFICGGTNFEKPLSKAAEYIEADPHGQSDVLFITDGQCEIRNAFKKSFVKLKRERKFKLYTIIMHSHTYHDYGDIGDISDEVLDIKRHDVSNWNEETNRRLYTLI